MEAKEGEKIKENLMFVKQQSFDVDFAPSHVTKYISKRTGLQITLIDQQSPIVNGYFAVATEIENDSGCPHTLEHLIFMGSRKYPYKGLLDTLGNRFFSSTNAWTGVDQTVYTLTTAGWEGFKTLLPIYLDHVFNPTLTEEACLTEVYHIDGKGKEKGVVFSEMQGIENQSWFINFLAMQRSLYPPTSGYSSETGGLLGDLRKLKNNQIIEFHKKLYRPDNLCVIISGTVDEEELLSIMSELDGQLPELSHPAKPRPFVDSPADPPLKETVVKTIEFSDKDESMGEVLISWLGPTSKDTLTNVALDVLGTYFTDSPISLLNKNLVEIDNPFATEIDFNTDDYLRTGLNLSMNGVPVEKLNEMDPLLKKLLKDNSTVETFDLVSVREILEQIKLKYVFNTEKSTSSFANIAISEFIYGDKDGSDLVKWIKDLNEYDTLHAWTAQQWCDLMNEWFINNHSVTILGKPSAKLYESNKKANKELSKAIKTKYGKEGLSKLGEILDNAQGKNDIKIPNSLLTKFGSPDPSKINFIQTKSYAAGLNKFNDSYTDDEFTKQLNDNTPADFPLYFHVENFKSEFLSIHLLFSSFEISTELLPYLNIIDTLFSSPLILPNEEIMGYEDVITNLKKDLIDYEIYQTFEGEFNELIDVKFKISKKNYSKAINWFVNIIHNMKFDKDRIKITLEKIINGLPEKKRDGNDMMISLYTRNVSTSRSVALAKDSIASEDFIREKLKLIEEDKFDVVLKELEEFKNQLFKLDNLRIVITGDLATVENPISSWKPFVESFENTTVTKLTDIPRTFMTRSKVGTQIKNDAFLLTAPATETTFLLAVTPIPSDYLHPDIFKIALASEYLNAVEGPFWRGIRGTGLAYGASLNRNLESGTLSFSIYRGSDAEQAFTVAKRIIDEFASGASKFETTIMENSIAAIVNELANAESNFIDAADSKFTDNILKKRGPNYNSFFLKQLSTITETELVITMKKYFQPLFNKDTSMVFGCLHPASLEGMSKLLSAHGYTINVEELSVDEHEEDGHGHDHDHDCSSCDEDDHGCDTCGEGSEGESESGSESGEGSEEEESDDE